MLKHLYVLGLCVLSCTSHALSEIPFHENDTIELALSQSNYNRVVVAGDRIKKASCPGDYLAIEYEKDGSVLFDVLYTKPFTVFFETKNGRHFAANIQAEDGLGKMVAFKPIDAAPKPVALANAETLKVSPVDPLVLSLIDAMSQDKVIKGFQSKRDFGSYRPLNDSLRFKVAKHYQGASLEGESIAVYNHSGLPVALQESWFADGKTKGVVLPKPMINPGETITVYRVLEKNHA